MIWNKRRNPAPQAEIRFLDDQPKPYVPPVPPPVPAQDKAKDKGAGNGKAADAKKGGGWGLILTTAAVVFTGGFYLKENGYFANGVDVSQPMPVQTFTVSDNPTVVVDSFSGPIEVVRGTDGRVEVEAIKEASGPDEAHAKAWMALTQVVVVGDEKKVIVTATKGSSPELAKISGDSRVRIKISVPRESAIEVKTSNASVDVRQVEGVITAKTSNGSIELDAVKGKLDLATSNGRIRIDGEDVLVRAETNNGSIDLDAGLADGESVLETSNGKVNVELASTSSFRLDAKTTNGKIRNEFRNFKADGTQSKSHIRGAIGNQPKAELNIRATNGSVRIERE